MEGDKKLYVREDVFNERMKFIDLSIRHVSEEISRFKRFCATLVIVGVPLLSAMVQAVFEAYVN